MGFIWKHCVAKRYNEELINYSLPLCLKKYKVISNSHLDKSVVL